MPITVRKKKPVTVRKKKPTRTLSGKPLRELGLDWKDAGFATTNGNNTINGTTAKTNKTKTNNNMMKIRAIHEPAASQA